MWLVGDLATAAAPLPDYGEEGVGVRGWYPGMRGVGVVMKLLTGMVQMLEEVDNPSPE